MRPQSVMLTFLGDHVHGRGICVSSRSFIEAFAKVGISEEATRSTLTRMVRRGLLRRHRSGRRMYFGLTPTSAEVLRDGERRIWHSGVVNDAAEDRWTLIGFSLPESWQRQRHELRSRLVWSGFGPLQNGLWIAPGEVDATEVIDDLRADLGANVKVFAAEPRRPTDMQALVREAYDLEGLGRRYREFLRLWDRADPAPEAPDDLARSLTLLTGWLQIIRADPRLPLRHLPGDWPAEHAQRVCHALHERFRPEAAAVAGRLLDTVPDDCWADLDSGHNGDSDHIMA
ncbi:Transcriptional repressor PaaX [Nonomuraea coxensis DSM 45129]|uniref:Transcriptional repressor PaaX n=1 Tax=Nonomuraea coxensis DSM 45129 TaxID=1122611 RepID=A0ABX8TWT6_9ACTN|nr:PaaX family transcriptional regulator C-terminal domain-containing protein [Nonomuraea coxensis]QYC39917.1 Transcriptional repressor PaaX [Nonomuraea coxensis DSM 45129]